jgi:hypothetical protein
MKLSKCRRPLVGRYAILVIVASGVGWLSTSAILPSVSDASKASRVSTAGFPSGPGNPGIFTERCRFSHQAADDPILLPRRPGRSMQHDFFGNVSTNATSTAGSLLGGATTCRTSADSSAYWSPVLYQHARPLAPISALIYWRRPRRETDPIHTVPAGLQIIAGNEMADHPQGLARVSWNCTHEPRTLVSAIPTASPHTCAPEGRLKLTVAFPSCWDGHTLSAVGQRNVVYLEPGKLGCPASHPVQIPQIVFHVIYPISSAAGLSLSMSPTTTGSVDTAHVDFINAWHQSILDADIRACVSTSTRCGPVAGPQATPHGPIRSSAGGPA